MDFIERLNDSVNEINNLPLRCSIGYLGSKDSLVLYPTAGGRVVNEFYDEVKDQELNYEFAVKSQDQEVLNKTLWLIQSHLENLKGLSSNDGSFDFEQIIITNKPYLNSEDDQGWFIYQLNITASLTTYN